MSRIFFDTNLFIYLLEDAGQRGARVSEIVERMSERRDELLTSTFTLAEVLVKPLSVGDVAFQDRSIRKMLSFRDSGQAVLFVSHNLSAVEMMCQRTVWLDHGRIRQIGPTADVVRGYLDSVDAALMAGTHAADAPGDCWSTPPPGAAQK